MNGNPTLGEKELVKLAERSRAGDREAFEQLVLLYQRKAMQIAINLLGNYNDGTEAVQEAFVKAYRNVRRLRSPERFGPWLLRIVANVAIGQLRRRYRAKGAEKKYACSTASGTKTGPDANEMARELSEAIRLAVRQLPKKEAKAIALYAAGQLSHSEVAEIMGCSVETARWYVHRARKKLKLLLKDFL